MSLMDLLRPKRRHSDSRVLLKTLPELTDQAILAEMAGNDPSPEVRLTAAEKLEDTDAAQGRDQP